MSLIDRFLRSSFTASLSKIEKIPGLSWFEPSSVCPPSEEDLSGFKAAQRLAYNSATTIGRELREGWTEQQACELMEVYLRDHGVKVFFHRPFAWFGERTRFQGFKKYTDFLPSRRRLKAGEAIILDVAPIYKGFVGDIGYSLSLGAHPGLQKMKEALLIFRLEIPKLFASGLNLKEIWDEVDKRLKEMGFDNAHTLYPFSVLGHRVHRISNEWIPSISIPFSALTWFSLQSYWAFLARGIFPELLGPNHVGPKIGLWAIEPHLGGDGFGAKFEEILVVDEKGARWLSDDVPHMREKKS